MTSVKGKVDDLKKKETQMTFPLTNEIVTIYRMEYTTTTNLRLLGSGKSIEFFISSIFVFYLFFNSNLKKKIKIKGKKSQWVLKSIEDPEKREKVFVWKKDEKGGKKKKPAAS